MENVNQIIAEADKLLSNNRGPQAEVMLNTELVRAGQEGDDHARLILANELMGYYRETSRVADSYRMAEEGLACLNRMGLQGTVAYANTMLNIANAYRAGGRLADSLKAYEEVLAIYRTQLPPGDMLNAGLHNNISLLYQEMKDFTRAKEHLLAALAIAEEKQASFETAVTCANLAATCLELHEEGAAEEYCHRSLRLFEAGGTADSHYCAALSSLGTLLYRRGDYQKAGEIFRQAMSGVERSLGKNEFYFRLQENAAACDQQQPTKPPPMAKEQITGLALCQAYYETYGKPMIREQFGAYEGRIAVGLVGEGSDCFGFDDENSRDHDWGPGFCMWLTEADRQEIGDALATAYKRLPAEFMGHTRIVSKHGDGRTGVFTVEGFYARLLGQSVGPEAESMKLRWEAIADSSLAAAVNGKVFRDDLGLFSGYRSKLLTGYPASLRYLKIAESAARFSQTGQYNYRRMLRRKEQVTVQLMLGDCIKEAMRLMYYREGSYPPHDKWLHRGLFALREGSRLSELLIELINVMNAGAMNAGVEGAGAENTDKVTERIEDIAGFLSLMLYQAGWISDTDPYLDGHTDELLLKAAHAALSIRELAQQIAETEFAAFDRVRNTGGRAACQNDWPTFSIMRLSQYLTWDQPMLLQYLYDFKRELSQGHNLIEEKYGRMMASTAPAEYAQIAHRFPFIDDHKQEVIEAIVKIQTGWMEAFAERYPLLAANARSIHTAEDSRTNTSYETYLRGEITTYSDKMLELYGRFVAGYATRGENLTDEIMINSVRMYGYEGLEEAEKKMKPGLMRQM